LEKAGIAYNLGWHHQFAFDVLTDFLQRLIFDYSKRQEMSKKARKLIDGRGLERVIDCFFKL